MAMSVTEETAPKPVETTNINDCNSAENFQSFIYQLFEKNGILNDLRAYLRGHIVNVLKSAQNGTPPACQKYFTQRLDLKFQSLNILIAEYLMRLEFSYSFSVFISEIPLGNMVFEFAKKLMHYNPDETSSLKFSHEDVCSVLNYLGIQCDSEHASEVMDAYANTELPLLLCILKGMPMFKKKSARQRHVSDISTSSSNSINSLHNKRPSGHDRCKHYAFCRTCQSRISRIKDKYRKKKKHLAKNVNGSPGCSNLDVDNLMRNISVMERSLIDEMFEQLKSVYEAEVEMLKAEEEKRLKRSLLSHSVQLQKQQEELEASFREREAALEQNVLQKKRFLWGLARTLREQHARLALAMKDLKTESRRLNHKEDSLRAQILEAEEVLRKKGEDMRAQISSELTKLEEHLVAMKRERDSINEERARLEGMKEIEHKDSQDLVKNELGLLKKLLEGSTVAKCLVDRYTVTDISGVNSRISVVLNNGQCVKNKNLVNDLKKEKNVNFGPSKLDEVYRERSRSSQSSEGGQVCVEENQPCRSRNMDWNAEIVQRLTEENERLKTFARQQRDHIDELSSAQARLQAEVTSIRFRQTEAAFRPRTAPASMPRPHNANTGNVEPVSLSWVKGAGEELSLFRTEQPRVFLPGDPVPFIGVLRDRSSDNRRHLINQWRCLRRRTSPLGGVTKHKDKTLAAISPGLNATVSDLPQTSHDIDNEIPNTTEVIEVLRVPSKKSRTAVDLETKSREQSPKSVLREAKEKLRKKRQSHLRNESKMIELTKIDSVTSKEVKVFDSKNDTSTHKIDRNLKNELETKYQQVANSFSADIDKYLKNYQNKFNLVESHFRNRLTAAEVVKPIPDVYSPEHTKHSDKNLLETPLTEFRKLYSSDKKLKLESPPDTSNSVNNIKVLNIDKNKESILPNRIKDTEIVKADKNAEFEILKHNINKIYNIPVIAKKVIEANDSKEENLLKVEIESEMSVHSQGVSVLVETVANIKVPETNINPNPMTIIISPKRSVDDDVELAKAVETINNINVDSTKEAATISADNSKEDNMTIHDKVIKTNVEAVSPQSHLKTEDLLQLKSPKSLNIHSSPKNQKESVSIDSKDEKPDSITSEISELKSKKTPRDEVTSVNRSKRSLSPEQEARLTRNDVLDAIFNDPVMEQKSSICIESPEGQAMDSLSEVERGDYGDNFSDDVDNYNSRSDVNEPISMPKTSEDDNFWDS